MDQNEMRGVDPNSMQVGGSHYQTGYQVWDFVENNGLGGLEMCIIKYICRWRDKGNGVVDLRKALHYIDKLIDLSRNRYRVAKGVASIQNIDYFCGLQSLPILEAGVVSLISRWACQGDLDQCRKGIYSLIESAGEPFKQRSDDLDR